MVPVAGGRHLRRRPHRPHRILYPADARVGALLRLKQEEAFQVVCKRTTLRATSRSTRTCSVHSTARFSTPMPPCTCRGDRDKTATSDSRCFSFEKERNKDRTSTVHSTAGFSHTDSPVRVLW